MYLIGDPPPDLPVVLAEINKMMKQDINATLDISYMSMGDYQKKYPTLLASGEAIDLIYAAAYVNFADLAQKNAFKELNELLPTYAPKINNGLTKEIWSQATIGGKTYMVPGPSASLNPSGFLIRGDLRKKYNVPEIKTINDASVYFDAVLKNEKGLIPLNVGADISNLFGLYITAAGYNAENVFAAGMMYNMNDAAPKLEVFSEAKFFEDYAKKTKEWADKGYWSKNAFSNKVYSTDAFKQGASAAAIAGMVTANEIYMQMNGAHPEWQVEFFPIVNEKMMASPSYINNGMAIPSTAKNPERALMALELLTYDERYNMLSMYGISGKHYTLTSAGKLALPAGVTGDTNKFPPEKMSPWGWRNAKFLKVSDGSLPNYQTVLDSVSKVLTVPKLQAFTLKTDNIRNEIAALSEVNKTELTALQYGMVDVAEGLKAYRDKQKAAGIEKARAEVEKQVQEYLASKK
ncbi:ABC transporter substrate-binding protein [Paenibacillus koleovorans]|uniref:ABC transporter substrate-binding protein n=1 Tax=Paenibacillus koleovorans TaxID=121608 RepID=UPI0013E39D66|nr:ABC transporter substrate-binding protein [Paenibacillus koleovorans]